MRDKLYEVILWVAGIFFALTIITIIVSFSPGTPIYFLLHASVKESVSVSKPIWTYIISPSITLFGGMIVGLITLLQTNRNFEQREKHHRHEIIQKHVKDIQDRLNTNDIGLKSSAIFQLCEISKRYKNSLLDKEGFSLISQTSLILSTIMHTDSNSITRHAASVAIIDMAKNVNDVDSIHKILNHVSALNRHVFAQFMVDFLSFTAHNTIGNKKIDLKVFLSLITEDINLQNAILSDLLKNNELIIRSRIYQNKKESISAAEYDILQRSIEEKTKILVTSAGIIQMLLHLAKDSHSLEISDLLVNSGNLRKAREKILRIRRSFRNNINIDLSDCFLVNIELSEVVSMSINFYGAWLHGASFKNIKLNFCNFDSASLPLSKIYKSLFYDSTFTKANISSATIHDTSFLFCRFPEANLRRVTEVGVYTYPRGSIKVNSGYTESGKQEAPQESLLQKMSQRS